MSNHALQKAAIVISSLDEEAADRLLEGMPDELASQIRMLSLEVDDLPEELRRAVLDEFLRNSGRKSETPAEWSDELELSASARAGERPSHSGPPPAADPQLPEPPPFAFLNDAPSELLGPFFQREHAQVTAVVLSYLEPARAAEILRQLTPELQADVIDRITELGQPDREIVFEISQRIRQLVSQQTQTFARRRLGLTAAQAILSAATQDQAAQLLGELKRRGSWVSQQLQLGQVMDSGGTTQTVSRSGEPAGDSHWRASRQCHPSSQEQLSNTYRPAVQEPRAHHPMEQEMDRLPLVSMKDAPRSLPVEPRFAFENFAQLDDRSLAEVLREAGPRVVLIALAGASPRVLKRIARGLGPRERRGLEQRIRDLQPLLLSDIEEAQRTMRRIAEKLQSGSAAGSRRLQVAA